MTRYALHHSTTHRIALLALVVSGVLLSGCETSSPSRFVSGLSPEQRAMATQVPVFHERLQEGSYREAGPVEGESCKITHDDGYRASEENAIEELQRATILMGANAVMEVSCKRLAPGAGNRGCFDSFICQGVAVHKIR